MSARPVDLHFPLTGEALPWDHSYALFSALCRVQPDFHMEAVQAGPWTGGASVSLSESVSAPTSSPAYSFLLSVDELLMLSERLAEGL